MSEVNDQINIQEGVVPLIEPPKYSFIQPDQTRLTEQHKRELNFLQQEVKRIQTLHDQKE